MWLLCKDYTLTRGRRLRRAHQSASRSLEHPSPPVKQRRRIRPTSALKAPPSSSRAARPRPATALRPDQRYVRVFPTKLLPGPSKASASCSPCQSGHLPASPHDLGNLAPPAAMEVELPARASSSQAKAKETPPPSPAASASATAAPPAEDAPLLPGEGVVRRRAVRERFAARSLSFRRDVGHAASETFLLTRLTLSLLRYLGIGYRWIRQFLALCCYALLLMPGFIQVLYYYFFSSQVHRSVVYGEQPRNRLDLYIPAGTTGLKPVVAFVTGGAWIIGYKGWGALLGRRLAERGILVACIDYRNFPQGTIGDMVEDVSRGISFVCNNIASYGGDPERIYLVGQSAGAHIAACALINQAIRECGEDTSTWSVAQLKAYFGISGGYNLLNLVDHFHRRGLYRSVFLRQISCLLLSGYYTIGTLCFSIMEGEESLRKFSPEVVVKDVAVRSAVSLLPQIILFHGTSDCSMPSAESEAFLAALQQRGAKADLFLYEGKTHTDLFLQSADVLRRLEDKGLAISRGQLFCVINM
ncbi:probable isoprenylcysteine alpha-carbonyl methylesterase ICMEL1 isoform X3 [Hordeum vulgare subsp. vulgare]|uniref:probable isoprenylcysteine alpha-carbonyl methylesterase ICMEL1 isoform X3 n=1 Tax=Hordeum vulgare subsp. vulgare TaxID=112509 RepID=UPI001D1A50ED|nr:probable isoprenylcysteine alpha-carbonyl methylesterase ICMEL1 isoform X3 [Hordeum vulgare subsp. vulgare]